MEDDDRVTRIHRPSEPVSDDRVTRIVQPEEARHDAPAADDRQTRMYAGEPPAPPISPAHAAPGQRRDWVVGARILQGQFELVQALRGGAQARAFRGRALDGREVFVKIQINPYNRDDTFAKQIELRPRLLSIQHPNLLRCLAYDIDHGDLCEVYEFVKGEELAAVIVRGPLDEKLTRQLIKDLAAGLQALHQTVGLMHRDLKPENVMLLQHEGKPCFRIIDYGIVSRIDEGGLTRVAGTVQYSPPERMQRFIENNELARAWDWWSVGSIVQEAIDGRHPYQRLRELFPGEVASRAQRAGGDAHAAEHLFDEIQREGATERYRMHAGMVEITERNPAAKPWLPLLRGLLTFNRDRRWGYQEVQAFLAGQTVPEYYAERRQREDDTSYDDGEGRTWRSVSEYAVALASEAARALADGNNVTWQKAKRLVYKGDFLRHVQDALHDADLTQRLSRCVWVEPSNRGGPQWDADLGTALALFVLAEGAISEPNVAGHAIDAGYARYVAAQAERRTDEYIEGQLRTLLGQPFGDLLRYVAPDACRDAANRCADSLSTLKGRIDELLQRAQQLGVSFPSAQFRDRPSLLVRLVSTEDGDDVRVIVEEYRGRLGGTTNRALQAIYGAPSLNKLPALDVKVVRLSLLMPEQNGYETHEATASRYQIQGQQIRLAEAYQRASRRMFHRPLWEAMVLFGMLSVALTLLGSATWTFLFAGVEWRSALAQFSELATKEKALLISISMLPAFGAALIYRNLASLATRDVNSLGASKITNGAAPRAAAIAISKSLASRLTDLERGSYRGNLRQVNRKLKALPNIDFRKYRCRTAFLPRSTVALFCIVLMMAVPLASECLWRTKAYAMPPDIGLGWARISDSPAPKVGYRYEAQLAQGVRLETNQAIDCSVPAGTDIRTNVEILRPQLVSVRIPNNVCPKAPTHQFDAWVRTKSGSGSPGVNQPRLRSVEEASGTDRVAVPAMPGSGAKGGVAKTSPGGARKASSQTNEINAGERAAPIDSEGPLDFPGGSSPNAYLYSDTHIFGEGFTGKSVCMLPAGTKVHVIKYNGSETHADQRGGEYFPPTGTCPTVTTLQHAEVRLLNKVGARPFFQNRQPYQAVIFKDRVLNENKPEQCTITAGTSASVSDVGITKATDQSDVFVAIVDLTGACLEKAVNRKGHVAFLEVRLPTEAVARIAKRFVRPS